MISIAQARQSVAEQCQSLESEFVELSLLQGRVASTDIQSPLNLPPFPQSSMDGYAVALGSDSWTLVGETRAGDPPPPPLNPGEARRIFTGAPVPESASGVCVVMQEVCRVEGDQLRAEMDHVLDGKFVRPMGSAVSLGADALPKGTVFRPGEIGFLAAMGLTGAEVHRKVRVSILASGDELAPPGTALSPGQIYESNTYALAAAVQQEQTEVLRVRCLPDEEQAITEAIAEALQDSDVLLLSGGISVGEYDFAGKALKSNGVEEIFYRVNQKPGKPLFFGRTSSCLVFALPGNPASALVCYSIYAREAIRRLGGHPEPALKSEKRPLLHPQSKTFPRPAFERAILDSDGVLTLKGQESYHLQSLAEANALLVLPEGKAEFEEGHLMDILHLPW